MKFLSKEGKNQRKTALYDFSGNSCHANIAVLFRDLVLMNWKKPPCALQTVKENRGNNHAGAFREEENEKPYQISRIKQRYKAPFLSLIIASLISLRIHRFASTSLN